MKIRVSHFTKSAERIFLRMLAEQSIEGGDSSHSPYCCDNLNRLHCEKASESGSFPGYNSSNEYKLFNALYFKDSQASCECTLNGWWPNLNGEDRFSDGYKYWDWESRIFALLLAAEIVRDGNVKKYLKK